MVNHGDRSPLNPSTSHSRRATRRHRRRPDIPLGIPPLGIRPLTGTPRLVLRPPLGIVQLVVITHQIVLQPTRGLRSATDSLGVHTVVTLFPLVIVTLVTGQTIA